MHFLDANKYTRSKRFIFKKLIHFQNPFQIIKVYTEYIQNI